VPFIRAKEGNKIKEELSGKSVSAIFDGTTRVSEALAVILNFISEDKTVKRIIKL